GTVDPLVRGWRLAIQRLGEATGRADVADDVADRRQRPSCLQQHLRRESRCGIGQDRSAHDCDQAALMAAKTLTPPQTSDGDAAGETERRVAQAAYWLALMATVAALLASGRTPLSGGQANSRSVLI